MVISGTGVVTAGFGASCVVGTAVGVRGAFGGTGGVLRFVAAGAGFSVGAAEGVEDGAEDGVREGVGVADAFVDGAADGDAGLPLPGPGPVPVPVPVPVRESVPPVPAAEVRAAPPWVVSSGV
ncbi:hypothetical protein [Streptomyces sp.]|uniref:hypothetical protein n=1 Tax=Streptomyces sp. TaxID=1931 RepID=UPI002810CBA1|nr:hypothetical protein [Streptomyces sp.]